MRSSKAFIMAVSVLLLSVLYQPVRAFTFDYHTTASALAEVGWYDALGFIAAYDDDIQEADNARSYATAFFDKIQYLGNVGVTALVEASVEPNEVILSGETTGSYEFDVGWDLVEYFYQDANSTVEGLLRIDQFPAGIPSRLQIDISFPNDTWDGLCFWQLIWRVLQVILMPAVINSVTLAHAPEHLMLMPARKSMFFSISSVLV